MATCNIISVIGMRLGFVINQTLMLRSDFLGFCQPCHMLHFKWTQSSLQHSACPRLGIKWYQWVASLKNRTLFGF